MMCKRLIYLTSVLVLSFVCTSYADVVIGDFEGSSMDGFDLTWEGTSTIALSNIGATSGSQSLAITAPANVFSWAVKWEGLVDLANYNAVSADITWVASEWAPADGIWVNFKDLAVNSDGPSGWAQYIPTDEVNPDWPGSWDPATWGDQTRTLTWDISGYDATDATWIQIIFSSNMGSVTTAGAYYIDNVQLIGAEPEPAEPSSNIIYVDATEGEAGNTKLVMGEVFTSTEDGSGSDNLWRGRAYGNSTTIFESGGQYGDGNTEDCPRLVTLVDVPENDYKVYVYFWADGGPWRIQASLTDSAGDLPLLLANDPASEATVAVAGDFAEPVPMLSEGNRTLWKAYLGNTGLTKTIAVYIDDDPGNVAHTARTWYDGIGYEVVSDG